MEKKKRKGRKKKKKIRMNERFHSEEQTSEAQLRYQGFYSIFNIYL